MRATTPLIVLAIATCLMAAARATPLSGQILETETARLLPIHTWEFGGAYELQTSSEGHEAALPFAIEYGVTSWFELLVEPVPYTSIRPKIGPQANGAGDIEATATFGLVRERGYRPALAFAGEVKIPTAKNTLIGTGKADYAGYIIASKRFGSFDTHANLTYTIIGQPGGERLNNIVGFAFGTVMEAGRYELFGEVLGTTAAAPEGPENPGTRPAPVIPEAAGGELVGTLGIGRSFVQGMLTYFSLSLDNNSALLFRPGIVWRWR